MLINTLQGFPINKCQDVLEKKMPEPYTVTKAEIFGKHLYDKVKIIELATEYNIPANAITTCKKHADKILKDVGHLSNKRKKNKISLYRDVKLALLYWLKEMWLTDVPPPLTKEIIWSKANR